MRTLLGYRSNGKGKMKQKMSCESSQQTEINNGPTPYLWFLRLITCTEAYQVTPKPDRNLCIVDYSAFTLDDMHTQLT